MFRFLRVNPLAILPAGLVVILGAAGIAFAVGAHAALQSSALKRFAAWLAGLGRRHSRSATDQPAA